MRRYRNSTNKTYITKGKDGKIKKVVSIKRSMAADRRVKSKTKPTKPGQGHRGDY